MTIPPPELRPEDFTRTYDLPESLTASIPPLSQPGEPGSHWLARGLMAETCARMLARPMNLDLIEQAHTIFVSALISLASTVLSSDPLGDVVSIELVLVKHSRQWALIYRDRMIAAGINVPAPAYLADLVHTAHLHRRTAQTDTCRGAAHPPKHLW
jgi:hypothetical protein